MTTIDTAALRARAAAAIDAEERVQVNASDLRALCDGYDEAARLRGEVKAVTASYKQQKHSAMVARDRDEKRARQRDNAVERGDRMKAQRDAARQALADLVADLKALRQRYGHWTISDADLWHYDHALGALIDHHAPEGVR